MYHVKNITWKIAHTATQKNHIKKASPKQFSFYIEIDSLCSVYLFTVAENVCLNVYFVKRNIQRKGKKRI